MVPTNDISGVVYKNTPTKRNNKTVLKKYCQNYRKENNDSILTINSKIHPYIIFITTLQIETTQEVGCKTLNWTMINNIIYQELGMEVAKLYEDDIYSILWFLYSCLMISTNIQRKRRPKRKKPAFFISVGRWNFPFNRRQNSASR